ncbi:MAG: hypothetical protein C4539_19600 [Ignavibacteriales bacterium]|nr:MAG: hypothetical protein C4539_19600 [Ignavibacteriales bacterium]
MKVVIKHCSFIFLIPAFLLLPGCSDKSVNNDTWFEYSERVNGSDVIPDSLKKIFITNQIGVISLNGTNSASAVSFLLDRTVRVTSQSLARTEFEKIILLSNHYKDSVFYSIESPSGDYNFYRCNLTLFIPYIANVYMNKPNRGIFTTNLESDLFAESESGDCNIEQHTGSVEVHTGTGNINAVIDIPETGFCKCYSETGDITIKIPTGISAIVNIKTVSGSISIKNLNVNYSINTSTSKTGNLGNGEATIYLESKKGKITLEGM